MTKDECTLCPRECKVNRRENKTGYCGVSGKEVYVSMASLHLWEEPYISGTPEMQNNPGCRVNGSGTIFFAGCNMHCVYCQNYAISNGTVGNAYTVEELANLMTDLEKRGAANINLVTPTHYMTEIIEAVKIAKNEGGLSIPVIYNCSGYEKVETLIQLESVVDIYLTDFKYLDEGLAKKYSNAKDYPQVAKNALNEMVRQQPDVIFDDNGEMMKKGVVVRHLLLPGHTKNAMSVMKYLSEYYGDRILVSLMSQYTPVNGIEKRAPELNRKVTKREYEKVVSFCLDLGMDNVFIQEEDVASESFIPAF